MTQRKVTIDALNESLLQESSKPFQESPGLDWEWDHFSKLQNIISQVEEKESNRNGQSETKHSKSEKRRRLEAVPLFMDWLQKQGVSTINLAIGDFGEESGLGLVTKVPIKTGDEVLVIPDKVMMTTVNAKESKLAILAEKDPVIRSMPNVLLSLFLLYEKFITKEASFWKTYIDLLPVTYDTILFFNLEEMRLLKNSQTTFREAVRMFRNIVRQYAYFHAVFRRATDSASRALRTVFTFKRYAWAASTAMTRQNSLTSPDKTKDELCLIPLWDMCNHEATGQFSNSYHPDEKYLACYATHDYEVGSEFLIYYGERSSVDHFVHGGFVPDTCINDTFNLEIGIGLHDKDLSRKGAILQEFGMKCQELFKIKPAILPKLKTLFVFVRLFQADTELLNRLEANTDDRSYLTTPSVEVWKFLATRLTILHVSAKKSIESVKISLSRNEIQKATSRNRQKAVLQLLQNEIYLLEILVKCAKDQLLSMESPTK